MSDVLDPNASTSAAFNPKAFAGKTSIAAADAWTNTSAWFRQYLTCHLMEGLTVR
jgi:hypothetical protein